MIVLRVANQSGCFYAWRQNVGVAHSVGVTDEQIAALEKGDLKGGCFTEAEQVAFTFTDEVMQLIEATDQTYDAAKKHFSDRALTEMLYVIGTYMLIACVIRTGRVSRTTSLQRPRSKPPECQNQSCLEVQLKRRRLCRTN